MRRLILPSIIALFTVALSAQTLPRKGAQLAPSTPSKAQTLTPAENSGKPSANARAQNTATKTQTGQEQPLEQPQAPGRTGLTPKSPAAPKTVPAVMPTAPQPKMNEQTVQVQWLSIEEALERSKTEKRKIFIDVYTDWCGWCKRMDESTFVDPAVAEYLNANYYPVKFNAEQQEEVLFNSKTYTFRRNGSRGYHELAAEWLNNRLSFPTVVFLDETQNVIQPIPGYLDGAKLETILNYFGTDSHKTTPWETYERKFTNNQK
ncbi:MAG: DUF255 domain-containing protein [Saprospiraceae bacterium]|jgi:thioredoxin-related protein|nr:DUF255 domain-containing protein [Saprospiraceae bacterium]